MKINIGIMITIEVTSLFFSALKRAKVFLQVFADIRHENLGIDVVLAIMVKQKAVKTGIHQLIDGLISYLYKDTLHIPNNQIPQAVLLLLV